MPRAIAIARAIARDIPRAIHEAIARAEKSPEKPGKHHSSVNPRKAHESSGKLIKA